MNLAQLRREIDHNVKCPSAHRRRPADHRIVRQLGREDPADDDFGGYCDTTGPDGMVLLRGDEAAWPYAQFFIQSRPDLTLIPMIQPDARPIAYPMMSLKEDRYVAQSDKIYDHQAHVPMRYAYARVVLTSTTAAQDATWTDDPPLFPPGELSWRTTVSTYTSPPEV